MPQPVSEPGLYPFLAALAIGIAAALGLRHAARRALVRRGQMIRIWPYVLGCLVGLPLISMLIFGWPLTFERPQLKGFNFAGGARIIPEFVALTVALSTYTGAFIAEIVRAGVMSVHTGQMAAGASLGLSRAATLRLIVVPQAMRVIVPPEGLRRRMTRGRRSQEASASRTAATKASTSSGEGGRPVRSSDSLRNKVCGSASGAGESPFCSSFAKTNRSIGFET